MRYVFLNCCLILSSVVSAARAEVRYERTKQGDHDIDVIRLTVTPAAEPVPALRYRLLTREIDEKAGNAAPFYYRAMLDLPGFMKQLREKFDEDKDLGPWYDIGVDALPIAELPVAKVREASQMF